MSGLPFTEVYSNPNEPQNELRRREHYTKGGFDEFYNRTVPDLMRSDEQSPEDADKKINALLLGFIANIGTQVIIDGFFPGLAPYSLGWFSAIAGCTAFFYFLQKDVKGK